MTGVKRPSSFSYNELLSAGDGDLLGPGYARLPAPPMLMFDRIPLITGDGGDSGFGSVEAELDVHPDLWFFACHFKEDPVMPGCLGLDALWQLLGFWLGWSGLPGKGRALGVGSVKFSGQILPDQKLVRYTITIRRVVRSRLTFAVADGTIFTDGKRVYKAKDLKVGLFTNL